MLSLFLRRLALIPPLLLAMYTITFALAWLIPGNPLENPEGRRPPPEVVEAMKKQYRLDDPVSFYFEYLGKASGVSWVLGKSPQPFDLGPSLRQPDWTVNEILRDALPVSVTLGCAAMLLALAIGMTAGVLSGLRPRGVVDAAGQIFAMIGVSVPSFVIGAFFTSCFCRQTWLVSSGWLGARVQHCVARHRAFAAIFRGGCASCARGHDRANEHGIRAHRAGQGFIAAARGRTSRIEKRISTSAELAGARYRRGVDRFICGGKSFRGARSWSSLCRRGLRQGHHVGHGHNAGVWASGGAVEFSGGHVVRMD